jgi:hypothetical protein
MVDFNCRLKERIKGIVAGHVRYQALSPSAGNDLPARVEDGVAFHVFSCDTTDWTAISGEVDSSSRSMVRISKGFSGFPWLH